MDYKKFSLFTAIFSLFFAAFLLSSCSKPGDSIVSDGMNALKKQNYDSAISSFNEALKTDTNYSDELIFTLLAAAYTQKNDFDSAILYHQKALSKRKDYSSYILLAVLLEQKDRTDEAKQTYRDAISFAPKRPEAYGSLGALELKSGNIKGAIELLEKSATLNDRIGVVQGDLAIAYAQNGEREKALNALENAEKLKTDGIESFRARVLSALGEGPALTAVPSPCEQ